MVKNWISDDLIHNKLPVLVILVPVMISSSGSVFWENWTLEVVEASEVAEAAEVNEAGVVSQARTNTNVDFRVFQVLEFNSCRTKTTIILIF